MFPLIVLSIVFILIAVRQIGNIKLQIWQVMLGGAAAALLAGSITPANALKSINADVMIFLFGIFIVGHALDESGYLSHISCRLFSRAQNVNQMILYILFGAGLASAILMNDTLAIIGTPVALLFARKHGVSPKLMLLALAFAVTIGSVFSPIGNPQNLLIAINGGIPNPFIAFLRYLFIPTILNLLAAFYLLKIFHGDHFHDNDLIHEEEPIHDHRLALLCKISIALIMILIPLKTVAIFFEWKMDLRLTHIAIIAALPVILFSPHRFRILKGIDWHTLIFFATMFILMESVWETGYIQKLIAGTKINITSNNMIFAVSIILSQLISNVPLVALYLPILKEAGAGHAGMAALAAASTIAGNLFILGAASNVIIIQNAEKKTGDTLTFWEFGRVGIPLTLLNALIYWSYLSLLGSNY